jgi:hypothetical protein
MVFPTQKTNPSFSVATLWLEFEDVALADLSAPNVLPIRYMSLVVFGFFFL